MALSDTENQKWISHSLRTNDLGGPSQRVFPAQLAASRTLR